MQVSSQSQPVSLSASIAIIGDVHGHHADYLDIIDKSDFLSKELDVARGERFGIFVGLWAPTFFALANRWM